jgi:type IV pilus assembly protein PilP
MKIAFAVAAVCGILLAGCANEQDDIQLWMNQQTAGMRGVVKPLPEIKIFPVVDYIIMDDLEPFNIARIEPAKPEKLRINDPRLDPDRQREPLEAYPLESLKMVGILAQKKGIHALIEADKALYQVHIGNFMGRNFGKVTAITSDTMEIQELVEDPNAGWVERTNSLQLQERQEAGK